MKLFTRKTPVRRILGLPHHRIADKTVDEALNEVDFLYREVDNLRVHLKTMREKLIWSKGANERHLFFFRERAERAEMEREETYGLLDEAGLEIEDLKEQLAHNQRFVDILKGLQS
jgi:hypothetical protein